MLESMNFTFNGKSCKDMGCIMVTVDSGLYKETFLPERRIIDSKIAHRNKPVFKRVELSPLSFTITIYLDKWKEENSLRSIARWLYAEEYKPLYFSSNPNNIYYAMYVGKPELFHNGCQDGYITLQFQTNSPFSYSPVKTFSINTSSNTTREFVNEGDLTIRPNIKITKRGNGNILILNRVSGEAMVIENLLNDEVVTINGEKETIVSSLEDRLGRYLFENHNDVWLDFKEKSTVDFLFDGSATYEFSLEYAYLQEYTLLKP